MPGQIFRTCCCCDLRTGVILIALFSMGIAAINIYTGVGAVLELKHLQPKIDHEEKDQLPIPWKYYDDTINLGWSNIAFFASDLIISVVLLIGALQRHKCLLTTWMVWTLVGLAYHLSVSIFFLSIWKGVPTFGYTMIIDLIIAVYFLLVVYSFKQEIINQERNPRIPLVMTAGQPIQGFSYPPTGVNPYQQAPPPYMYPASNPPPYAQCAPAGAPPANEQKVPL
ncbi:uncharacterized protein LOC116293083 [Actinia tenebrosa]|uniref:Uncharacterized protein LOC116293083 n=1 Tax=Actinia tenebrosa TaxID=6105 RepID=A0A6P8HIX9_ACTTE|nr:uncharacterized protein LOC116293083 [Actinia tenebrosa]